MNLTCHACQRIFDIPGPGDFLCPHCGAANQWMAHDSKRTVYWEEGWRKAPLTGYVETLRALLITPTQFFRYLRGTVPGPWGPLLSFALISQGLGFLASSLLNVGLSLLGPALTGISAGAGMPGFEMLSGALTVPFVILATLIFLPLMVLGGLFISSGITHIMAWLIIGTNKPFEATVKLTAYAMGVNVLMVVPILGALVATVWQMILLVIGVREVHQTSTGRALFVVILPFLLFCGCILGVVFFILSLAVTGGVFGAMSP